MKKVLCALLVVFAVAGCVFARDFVAQNEDANGPRGKLKEAAPEVMSAFGDLGKAVLKDGAVSLKTKELIAVALSVQNRCENCIMSHVGNAIKAGVTREELVDALGVCILMGGGPNSAYAGTALEVYDQFKAKAEKK